MNLAKPPAGPELDRLIAEKWMRWSWGLTGADFEGWCGAPNHGEWDRRSDAHRGRWEPSTDIAHAWQAFDKTEAPRIERQESDSLDDGEGGIAVPTMWIASHENTRSGKRIEAEAETAPLAICYAILKGLDPVT